MLFFFKYIFSCARRDSSATVSGWTDTRPIGRPSRLASWLGFIRRSHSCTERRARCVSTTRLLCSATRASREERLTNNCSLSYKRLVGLRRIGQVLISTLFFNIIFFNNVVVLVIQGMEVSNSMYAAALVSPVWPSSRSCCRISAIRWRLCIRW